MRAALYLVAVAALVTFGVSASAVAHERQSAYASGIHVVVACGTTELSGPGVSASAVAHERQSAYASGIHVVVACGTTELSGPGLQANLIQSVTAAIPSSYMNAVDYPTSLALQSSTDQGVKNMTVQVTSYAQRCPNTRMVLIG